MSDEITGDQVHSTIIAMPANTRIHVGKDFMVEHSFFVDPPLTKPPVPAPSYPLRQPGEN